jgi:hypothetical protein
MQQWICIRECFVFSTHFFIGDVIQSEKCPNHHFTLLEGLEEHFSPTGRRFLVEGGRITGVWDG